MSGRRDGGFVPVAEVERLRDAARAVVRAYEGVTTTDEWINLIAPVVALRAVLREGADWTPPESFVLPDETCGRCGARHYIGEQSIAARERVREAFRIGHSVCQPPRRPLTAAGPAGTIPVRESGLPAGASPVHPSAPGAGPCDPAADVNQAAGEHAPAGDEREADASRR